MLVRLALGPVPGGFYFAAGLFFNAKLDAREWVE